MGPQKSLIIRLLVIFALFTSALSAEAARKKKRAPRPKPRPVYFDEWQAVKTPTTGPAQVFGGYTDGCIAGAVPLPLVGFNYAVTNLEQERYYGHPNTIQFIQRLAAFLYTRGTLQILIEDISAPRGGPFRRGHQSHQSGLDIDISFHIPKVCLTAGQRVSRPEVSFVDNHKTLKPNWTHDQNRLIIASASAREVDRLFVSPVIKKHLCTLYPDAWWLYKVRAWWKHEDHLHVRLKCPEGDKTCKAQPALNPEVKQCGADLDVWLKKVASLPPDGPPPKHDPTDKRTTNPYPRLPVQCEQLRQK